MHRIDTSTAQKDKFGAGKAGFTHGNAQAGVPATEVSAEFLDSVQEEIAAVIEDSDSGEPLDKSKNNQLVTAIKAIIRSVGMLASETARGVIKIATQAQTDEGAADDVAVTPKKLKNHYKKSNILGRVSLSAGVPTGAVIESGSNANGTYVKYADGTLLAIKTIDFQSVSLQADTFKLLDIGGVGAWPWPATFLAIPTVSIQFVGSQSYAFQVQAENITETTVGSFHLRNHWPYQMSTIPKIQVIAVGKW